MMIDINGNVIATAVSTFVTVGGILIWFGLNVLGKISGLTKSVADLKDSMAEMKVEQKASVLHLDIKLDKWGERLGEAEIHIAVLNSKAQNKDTED